MSQLFFGGCFVFDAFDLTCDLEIFVWGEEETRLTAGRFLGLPISPNLFIFIFYFYFLFLFKKKKKKV